MEIEFCSKELKSLAGAMLLVQGELCPAIKDAENPFAKSRYASLNSVVAASRDALLRHGVWLTQYPVPVESGHLGLVSKLVHGESGEYQASLLVMPLAKLDPQGYGSAITYARRYALAALVGLVVEDDDGEMSCGEESQRQSSAGKNMSVENTERKRNGRRPLKTSAETGDKNLNAQIDVKGHIEGVTDQLLKSLPKLDGISYQIIKAPDGKLCIMATGNTSPKKDLLSGTGFRWNPERKIWWRYA